MAYLPLRCDPGAPRGVRDFVAKFVDMQFADVHCMLKLPQPNRALHAGCHFAVVNTLLALVSGIATVFFSRKGSVTDGFLKVLEGYYPWNEERPGGLSREEAPKVLWEYFRSPLAHSLATDTKQHGGGSSRLVVARRLPFAIGITKRALRESALEALERGDAPPVWLTPTVTRTDADVTLYPHALYRGVRRMVEKLTTDPVRMKSALEFLEELVGQREPPEVSKRREGTPNP